MVAARLAGVGHKSEEDDDDDDPAADIFGGGGDALRSLTCSGDSLFELEC